MYKIVRFYHPSTKCNPHIIKTGLTLAEAQAHCQNPSTRKENEYFDGYEAEEIE